ncbi:hypothetical protein [Streptomyces violaceusniger]
MSVLRACPWPELTPGQVAADARIRVSMAPQVVTNWPLPQANWAMRRVP